MYKKWIKHFTETVLAVNLHFQHIGLNLQETQVHHSKERMILVKIERYDFTLISLYLYMISAFEGHREWEYI
jgi:hypothetical protein